MKTLRLAVCLNASPTTPIIWLDFLGVGVWLTIIGPLTITILILKVSGIPMLEKPYLERADFKEYRRRTSAFFPLPPR